MKNFKHKGELLSLIAPRNLAAGDAFLAGSIFAVATMAASSGATVECNVRGVIQLPKTTGQAWTPGQRLYWDDANRRCDTGSAAGSLIGAAAAEAVGSAITAAVCLAGVCIGGASAGGATKPATPVKPVLTALTSAISVAYTVPSDGGSSILEAQFLDINGIPTALTTNPQTIAAAAGVSITGTVRFRNAIGWSDYSPQATAVVPTAPSAVPFSSTQAFTTGQQVFYAGGLYTFNSDHAAGNWTGADVTYNGQSGSQSLNAIGFSKPFGVTANFTPGALATATTSAPTSSRAIKQHAEAPFTRVKVISYQREPSPQRGFGVSLASTETAAVDTMSNAIDPVVNGAAYSVTRANSAYGLLRVTWAGAQRSPVQAPGGVTPVGQGYVTNMHTVFSDWTAVQSVTPLSGRPLLVARINQIANIGDATSNVTVATMTAEYSRYAAAETGARLYYCPGIGSGDHVADPTLSKSGGNVYNPAASAYWYNIAFLFDHVNVPTRNFAAFGDSITEGYRWWQLAVWRLSTQKAPCYVANFGCSTNRTAQYQALMRAQLREENCITEVLLPSFGQNELPADVTDAFATQAIADLQDLIALCVARKVRLYIWTAYSAKTSRFSGFPVCVSAITRINNWVRANEALGYKLVEVDAGWNNTTMNGDLTHPNETGVVYMTGQLQPVIQVGVQ